MVIKVEYSVSEEFLRNEFIRTGESKPATRHFRFESEELTPKQRTLLTWAMPFDSLMPYGNKQLTLYDFGRRVNPIPHMRLDHEIQDVDELFVHVLEMLAAAARNGIDPTEISHC